MAFEKIFYYAVNGSGQGVVFTSYPQRDHHLKIWVGDIVTCFTMAFNQMEAEGLQLPAIKWSDEPVTVNLKVEI